MTAAISPVDIVDWAALGAPFPDTEVKERQGPKQHQGDCTKQYGSCTQQHRMLSYIDARAVAQRLDDVVTPSQWEFTCSVIPGSDIVKGRLVIAGIAREDHGYPNSDRDEEPIKAATSDALKRCAVLFGIGRHLYDDNQNKPRPVPQATVAAPNPPRPAAVRNPYAEDPYPAEITTLPAARTSTECPVHHKPWKTNSRGSYCATKLDDGSWCKEQP